MTTREASSAEALRLLQLIETEPGLLAELEAHYSGRFSVSDALWWREVEGVLLLVLNDVGALVKICVAGIGQCHEWPSRRR